MQMSDKLEIKGVKADSRPGRNETKASARAVLNTLTSEMDDIGQSLFYSGLVMSGNRKR